MSEQIESVDFYWRPGCGFCMALDRKLTKIGWFYSENSSKDGKRVHTQY